LDNLVLEYRDPIIGIILVVFLVFLISFFTYSYSIYKERIARKDYRKLSRRFELGKLKEDDYVNLYKTYNLPFDSILLLASTFLHQGDNNRAIAVYLELLEHTKDIVKKEEVLELLGNTYLKGGFLQRANDIYLKILKFSPRNKSVLKSLLIVCEKLKDFDKALQVLDSLNELNVEVEKDRVYIKTLIVLNDSILSYEKRTQKLYELFHENKAIERVFIQFLLQFNKEFFWQHIEEFDCKKAIDILWYQNKEDIDFNSAKKSRFLEEVYNAKGYIETLNKSDDFTLDILILATQQKKELQASLNFEFICNSCKHLHPFFETRCPNCHSILTLEVKYYIVKGFFIENQSLQ